MRKTMKQRWLSIIGVIVSIITIATLSACTNEQQDNSNPGQSSLSTTESNNSKSELSEEQSDKDDSSESQTSNSKEESEEEKSNSNVESESDSQNEEKTTTEVVTTIVTTTTIATTTTTEAPTTTTTPAVTTVTTTTALSLPEHNGIQIPEDEYKLLVEGAETFGINNYEIIYSTEFIEGSLIVPSMEWYNSADAMEIEIHQSFPELPTAANGYGRRQAWKMKQLTYENYNEVSDIFESESEFLSILSSTITEQHMVFWRYTETEEENTYAGLLYYNGGGKMVGRIYSADYELKPGWCLIAK